MKKIILIALGSLLLVCDAMAQSNNENQSKNTSKNCPQFYIGFSGGVNNQAGVIGFNLELPINHSVTLNGGAGGGSWGTKGYIEARYYFEPICYTGWAIGAGITHSAGIYDMKLSLPDAAGEHHDVNIESKPMSNAFVAGYKFWKLGRNSKNRFYIEAGCSVPFGSPQYIVKSGEALTEEADRTVRILSPGGLIAAIGFSFAL